MFARRRSCGRTATIIAALGLALTATACGGGSGEGGDGPVELRFSWWGNADRAAITEEAIALFEQRNPGVDVVTSFQDYEPYWQRIATETAGGGAPDVFQMDYSYLSEYADRGVLLDLEEYAGGVLEVDDFVPGLEQAGVVDGTRVAVPWSGNTFATVYVPAEYEEAGVEPPREGDTWEEFDSKIAQFDGAATGDVRGGGLHRRLLRLRDPAAPERRRDVHRGRQARLRARRPGGVLATQPGAAGRRRGRPGGEGRRGGAGQRAGVGWDNFLVRYEGEQEQDVAIAPLPTGGTRFGQYIKPSMLLSAASNTEHPEEAAKLIDFLLNDPEAAAILGANRGLPATQGAREAADLQGVDAEVAEYEASIADRLEPTPVTPPAGAGSLEAAFIRIHEEMSYGRISVEDAVEQFFGEADRLLAS
jgi:multiple sugar transport system substrate-binding protein